MNNTDDNNGSDDRTSSDPTASPGADPQLPDHQVQPRPRYSDGLSPLSIVGWFVGLLVLGLIGQVTWIASRNGLGRPSSQGRVSATRSAMQNLKTALVCFQSDVGRLPHLGGANDFDDPHVNGADAVLDAVSDRNILFVDTIKGVADWQTMGFSPTVWKKRWKGPYMDSDPTDFMMDAWNHRIHYCVFRQQIWLWSAGPDGTFDDLASVAQNLAPNSDDIAIIVSRLKGPGFATDTVTCPPPWDCAVGLNVDQPVATAAGSVGGR